MIVTRLRVVWLHFVLFKKNNIADNLQFNKLKIHEINLTIALVFAAQFFKNHYIAMIN